jgi:DNA repair protein REV1
VGKSLGTLLWSACRGIDDRPLIAIPSRNSVSIDVNYGLRFDTLSRAENFLRELSAAVSSRMTEAGVRGGQTLTVKLLKRRPGAPEPFKQNGHGICDAVSKCALI